MVHCSFSEMPLVFTASWIHSCRFDEKMIYIPTNKVKLRNILVLALKAVRSQSMQTEQEYEQWIKVCPDFCTQQPSQRCRGSSKALFPSQFVNPRPISLHSNLTHRCSLRYSTEISALNLMYGQWPLLVLIFSSFAAFLAPILIWLSSQRFFSGTKTCLLSMYKQKNGLWFRTTTPVLC